MKIYTKGGDKGCTSLVTGERVSKADARVCAYGDMDELISYLGLLRCESPENDELLRTVQQDLMLCSAWVATASDVNKMESVGEGRVFFLEKEIDRISASLPPMTSFILPAGTVAAAHFQIARTVCRRTERAVISLRDERENVCKAVCYLNRLSDLLFVMGREAVVKEGKKEDFWRP
ncbi:MAG: cob(I)yrinic acid a,c-diamide adenosyltransferase [Alistipes sp.]|nr:cob(I)yrinic acid a,c-diamide adenosyltransferase [Candidatus Minthomonas equi]